MSRSRAWLLLGVWACGDIGLNLPPPPPPAEPPVRELDLWGTPPTDWRDCYPGLRGIYYNLAEDHPDVERLVGDDPVDTDSPPLTMLDRDWWSGDLAFQRYDRSQDFGPNWWPVDGGFSGDPKYFAARWVGWLRVTRRDALHEFVVGGASDVAVILDGELLIERTDLTEFETTVEQHDLTPGVRRLDIRYAHRLGSTNGFRFRTVSEELLICYPEFGDPAE